jgi:hypothetical protein
MLILDERETRQTNKPDNEITDREVAAGKIIDFEKARRALEKDRFCQNWPNSGRGRTFDWDCKRPPVNYSNCWCRLR